MLCIDGADGERDIVPTYGKMRPIHLSPNPSASSKTMTTSTTATVAVFEPSNNSIEVTYQKAEQKNFFDGLLGCFKPVWTIIGKAGVSELKQQGMMLLLQGLIIDLFRLESLDAPCCNIVNSATDAV